MGNQRERAQSFAEVAEVYERSRPRYPDEAVRWLVGEEVCEVVDLGAGTGKLTRSLVALGHRVTAIEPLAEMRALLQRAIPGATALDGSAEDIPLADASADVVVCAQAFHWFDHEPALAEIARVLRRGGRLSLVWNTRDNREPWVAQLSAVIGSDSVEGHGVSDPVAASERFGPLEEARFSFVQPLNRTDLLELVLSRSYCAVKTESERAPVLDQVGRLFDAHAEGETIELPYLTECFRSARI